MGFSTCNLTEVLISYHEFINLALNMHNNKEFSQLSLFKFKSYSCSALAKYLRNIFCTEKCWYFYSANTFCFNVLQENTPNMQNVHTNSIV